MNPTLTLTLSKIQHFLDSMRPVKYKWDLDVVAYLESNTLQVRNEINMVSVTNREEGVPPRPLPPLEAPLYASYDAQYWRALV